MKARRGIIRRGEYPLAVGNGLRYTKRNRRVPRGISLTICVAAICESYMVIGASDRMLTSGDIQFEPPRAKILQVTNSIGIMTAGETGLQSEIYQKIGRETANRIQEAPTLWIPISDVAELYSRFYNEARLQRVEREILAPIGLDSSTFVTRQRELDPQFIRQLATEMFNYEMPRIEAIICGLDMTGAHIYVVSNNSDGTLHVNCQDSIGFAAIGTGGWHASSLLMFGGHTWANSVAETLRLVYFGKKRAEVAPGVGHATDMVAIGPRLGSYVSIEPSVTERLEKVYQREQKGTSSAAQRSKTEVEQYVRELSAAATQAQAAGPAQDGGGNPPPDQKELRGDAEESQPPR